MTTIAFRDKTFAADSRETWADDSGTTVNRCEKLFRVRTSGKQKREVVIATAGGSFLGMVFVDWFKRTGGSGNADPPVILRDAHLEEDFTVLIWDRGKLFVANHLCRPIEVLETFTAIGSGRKAALAAMHCGKNAYQAVHIACKVDPYTAVPIKTMRVR